MANRASYRRNTVERKRPVKAGGYAANAKRNYFVSMSIPRKGRS